VRPADVDELTEGDPREVALENARRKALAIPGELVLGADTDVALDGDILGKPRDAAHARQLVGRLNGRTHEVVGGIALARGGEVVATAVEVTSVTFKTSDDAALDRYVATGEWDGRAGGYAIQGEGAALVDRIQGDYLNVVGLPLERLLALLRGV
jgi:septum formation protein